MESKIIHNERPKLLSKAQKLELLHVAYSMDRTGEFGESCINTAQLALLNSGYDMTDPSTFLLFTECSNRKGVVCISGNSGGLMGLALLLNQEFISMKIARAFSFSRDPFVTVHTREDIMNAMTPEDHRIQMEGGLKELDKLSNINSFKDLHKAIVSGQLDGNTIAVRIGGRHLVGNVVDGSIHYTHTVETDGTKTPVTHVKG